MFVLLVIALIFAFLHYYGESYSLQKQKEELEKENKELRKANETLKDALHDKPKINDVKPNPRGFLEFPSGKNNILQVDDKIPSSFRPMRGVTVKKKLQGSFSTVDELENALESLANEGMFIFTPGGFATCDRYTYTSPTGATFHLDANRRITKIEGTVYRSQK